MTTATLYPLGLLFLSLPIVWSALAAASLVR